MMRFDIGIALGLLSHAAAILASPDLLWQIGSPDKSYREFAIAGRYALYPRTFPHDVIFRVGKDESPQSWPYIHPGPADAWAGSRPHSFRIVFDLHEQPEGNGRLIVEGVDAHAIVPPVLRIDINGNVRDFEIVPGAGDASLADPAKGRPFQVICPFSCRLLSAGRNRITLTLVSGSWVLYDALSLEVSLPRPTGPDVRAFSLRSTPFFIRSGRAARQAMALDLDNWGKATTGTLDLQLHGGTFSRQVSIPAGASSQWLPIPAGAGTGTVSVQGLLKVEGHLLKAEAVLAPARAWKIYVALSSHTDIGYTDLQERTEAVHVRNLKIALDACRRLSGFKWNVEVSRHIENFLRQKQKEEDELMQRAREGRIGVHAIYLNLLTGLLGHEEMNRIVYFAQELRRRFGIRPETATITDVPTCVGTLPGILRASGIRYFAEGVNSYRGPFFAFTDVRSPFWWEGLDGSRVLTWLANGYAQANAFGLFDSVQRVEKLLPGFLSAYSHPGYPYDAVLLYGAFGDNQTADPRYAQVAARWNRRFAYPKIIIATDQEFFRYIETHFKGRIPTFRGDAGAYWEDGAASSAAEMAENRATQNRLPNAEKLLSLGKIMGQTSYPKEKLRHAWEEMLLFDEHTWGAAGSISEPTSFQTREQWKRKAAYGKEAALLSKDLLQQGQSALGRLFVSPKEGRVAVLNPLSWERTEVVATTLPSKGWQGRVILEDLTTGHPVPSEDIQVLSSGEWLRIAFLARRVPSLGYRLYRVSLRQAPAQKAISAVHFRENGMENRFFRIRFDPSTGAIVSLYDKRLRREWVDQNSPYRLNEYLYARGGDGTQAITFDRNLPSAQFDICRAEAAGVAPGQNGPVMGTMRVVSRAYNTPRIVSEITLYRDIPRIAIRNHLLKRETLAREGVYFAFPFEAVPPCFRFEVPNGIMRPEIDQLKGACKDWFAVQHWVEVSDGKASMAWATVDSPLVSLGDIHIGRWLDRFEAQRGSIFAYIMNNYWNTNYKASQGGHFDFRYSLMPSGSADALSLSRFGWEVSNPMIALYLPPSKPEGSFLPPSASFLRLDRKEAVLLTLKEAEDGDGWIVRLLEVSGRSQPVKLSFPIFRLHKAALASLVEERRKSLTAKRNTVTVPLRARSVATVRVWLERKR